MSFITAGQTKSPGDRIEVQLQQKGYGQSPPIQHILLIGHKAHHFGALGVPVLPGCILLAWPDVPLLLGKNTGAKIILPMNPKLHGTTLYLQMVLYEVGSITYPRHVQAISFSDAARVTLNWKK